MKAFKWQIVPFIVLAVIVQTMASVAGELVDVCSECHGIEGISTDSTIPNLAGQDRLYLENQIAEFRYKPSKGLEAFQLHIRNSHIMDGQSNRFDADELAAITDYFSDMRCSNEGRAPVETVSVQCGECHGNDGVSQKPGVPHLAGQKEAYLLAQLMLFKATILQRNKRVSEQPDGTEGGVAQRYHRTMGQWAARLSVPEMIIVARYYSSLPGVSGCK